MTLNIIILLLAGISGSLILVRNLSWKQENFRLALVFAGGYLFAITILHIIPGLFISGSGSFQTGIFVLVGFFLQQGLEYLSSGVEHGHFHIHDKGHHHDMAFGWSILAGLSIHAFLEGTMLSATAAQQIETSSRTLLTGVVLHKVPASLALVTFLQCCVSTRSKAFLFMLIFACMSPAGLLLSDYIYGLQDFSQYYIILFAIVAGSFLHISTTIVFESSDNHKFNLQRLIWSLLGAGAAILAELIN